MEYEKNRLNGLGREDLAEKIKWISKENDGTGYDIISFDIDEEHNVIEKYIEVKTTESNDNNVFFISANEINVMEKLKNQYFIYRVYNLKTKHPEVYILNYNDFHSRIELSVENYVANLIEE